MIHKLAYSGVTANVQDIPARGRSAACRCDVRGCGGQAGCNGRGKQIDRAAPEELSQKEKQMSYAQGWIIIGLLVLILVILWNESTKR
jgi:hypothetical protein